MAWEFSTEPQFVVPRDAPGVEVMDYPAIHNHIRYRDVRYQPHAGLWPTEYIPAKREQARKKYARLLDADPDLAAWADAAARTARVWA